MLPQQNQVTAAVLGLGNVGRAFLRYVQSAQTTTKHTSVKISAVADSSGGLLLNDSSAIERLLVHKESGRSLAHFASGEIIKDRAEFIRSIRAAGIAYLIESLPTNIADGQPALDLITTALEQGLNVVTVDKGPLVHGFERLKEAAVEGGACLEYSGTTGVGIPDELAGDRVLEIRGILNGTTNHILSEMQGGEMSFDQALANAQASGIAEPDPALDVQGWDTASKILILAKSLMGAQCKLAEVSRIGIGPETESLIKIGRESGRMVRLVGRARIWQGRVRVSVAPKLVERDSPFYSVSGTSKAALFRTERQGMVLVRAQSGRDAISQIILDDIARIANSVLS
jgi:homoserine dehydrogenase